MKRLSIVSVFIAFMAVPMFAGLQINLNGENSDGVSGQIKFFCEGTSFKVIVPKGIVLYKNDTVYFMDEASKTYFSMAFDAQTIESMQAQQEQDETRFASWGKDYYKTAKFTKTGVTKTIAGYTCTEYKVEYNGQTVYCYYTTDAAIIAEYKKFMNANPAFAKLSPYSFLLESYGFIMGVKENNKMTIEITEIKITTVPQSTFSLEGYSPMSFGN